MTSEAPVLAIEELRISVGSATGSMEILRGVDLEVFAGEVVGVLGESGSGKSVLVRAILQLLPDEFTVDGGRVKLNGLDLITCEPSELRRVRGKELAPILSGAKTQLNPLVRVGDMLRAVARVHGKSGQSDGEDAALAALKSVGIPDPERRLGAYPHELSGGMAQRVCIALALMHDPSLIVADEPTFGLDVTVQRQVLDLMASLVRDRQASQLIVTRDLGIAAQYCQRVAVLQNGSVVEIAPTTTLFESPQHPYTRRLLSAVRKRSSAPAASHG